MPEKHNQLDSHFFRTICNHLQEAVLVISGQQDIAFFNSRFLQLFKLSNQQVQEMKMAELHECMKRDLRKESNVLNRIDALNSVEERPIFDVLHLNNDHALECNSFLYHGQNNFFRVFIFRDISERLFAENDLFNEANYDALTGLPNRNLLFKRLEVAFNKAKKEKRYGFAILFLDIDELKPINDTMGHVFGDTLLKETSQRLLRAMQLEANLSLKDGDFVARLGGDEFIILFEANTSSDFTESARNIQRALQKPIVLGEKEVQIKASMGLAYFDKKYSSIHDMIHDADLAMYQVKSSGKGSFRVFGQ